MPPTFATEWNTATAGDRDLFQAPFRAGIQLNAYQLLPLRKALRHPRVNRLIADDVGLGKTVEAGLIVRELLLRRRIDLIVVAARAGMVPQWQHQLEAKFGLAFTIINREHVVALRRPGAFLPSRGLPWVGWRGVFWVLATATLLCACLIILAVPDASVMKEPEDWRTNIQGFFDVYATPAFWLVAPLSASVIGTAFAVHGYGPRAGWRMSIITARPLLLRFFWSWGAP